MCGIEHGIEMTRKSRLEKNNQFRKSFFYFYLKKGIHRTARVLFLFLFMVVEKARQLFRCVQESLLRFPLLVCVIVTHTVSPTSFRGFWILATRVIVFR